MTRLAGKTALITGAARGIGKAFAEAYLREGARVIIADIDQERAAETANELSRKNAMSVHMDVTNTESIQEALGMAESDGFGPIDILINNAAIFSAAPITEITEDDFARCFDINVKGTLFTMQAVAQHMINKGIKGRIINMASQAGRRGEPLVAVYCATKAAVISLTQSAGLNLIQHGINVNAIAPGVVDGEHWDGVDAFFAKYEGKAPGQKKREVGEAVPFGRMGTAEDLTGMAVFLASDEAEYIVAQCYNVDGGQWMS
ncbi:sorbitol dehydrogenase [Tateyamaria omphalii]|uniref:L-iditol 2-dehydrogenase n=1 Tax=Tateyamaria omphalii TaxID=299262 RepID=UPI0016776672|nr:L-iditol 2-dehydrogenase [Tateyamaria omphalii]GGX65601.1 sorbitol dehydrogenase [Tateyamaria omphalii]